MWKDIKKAQKQIYSKDVLEYQKIPENQNSIAIIKTFLKCDMTSEKTQKTRFNENIFEI